MDHAGSFPKKPAVPAVAAFVEEYPDLAEFPHQAGQVNRCWVVKAALRSLGLDEKYPDEQGLRVLEPDNAESSEPRKLGRCWEEQAPARLEPA